MLDLLPMCRAPKITEQELNVANRLLPLTFEIRKRFVFEKFKSSAISPLMTRAININKAEKVYNMFMCISEKKQLYEALIRQKDEDSIYLKEENIDKTSYSGKENSKASNDTHRLSRGSTLQ
jgi:hypothetical protein